MEELTTTERERAIRLIEENRDRLCESVSGLSDAQWTFKPAPDRWSVLDNVEHLAVLGDRVRMRLSNFESAPPSPPDRSLREIDAMLLTKVVDRSIKLKAPEPAEPTGRWTPVVAVEQYRTVCAGLTEVAQTPTGLREHAVPHPIFGPMDGYQWLLAAGAHSDRHNQQIAEVKSDANFPSE
jgi:hypothetical protein